MQEQWIKWRPIASLEPKYNIENIEQSTIDGFKIIFTDIHNKGDFVTITFKNGILAHRETDESFTLSAIKILKDNYGSAFFNEWTFFKVTNSLYIKWLSEQSGGLSDSYPLTHYSFLAGNAALDILNDSEPIVELGKSKT